MLSLPALSVAKSSIAPSKTDLTFGWEPLAKLLSEGNQHWTEKHWREIALDHDDVPLDVDWKELIEQERRGQYKVFVARRDGKMVGYLPFMFWYPARYRGTLFIQDDTVYVLPTEDNRARVWFEMLDRAIELLPKPAKLQMRVRPQHGGERIGKILEKRYGMRLSELTYTKVIS